MKPIGRRQFLGDLAVGASAFAMSGLLPLRALAENQSERPPNFIVIFIDDMGYGDLGCYGSKLHRTPMIDGVAEDGMRFTDFYVTSPVCSPSRAALMTGCYPRRINLHEGGTGRPVLYMSDPKGIHPDETTIAEMLYNHGPDPGRQNYATACIGKWHLGDQQATLPTRHGFQYHFGLPYSNDMSILDKPNSAGVPPLALLRNGQVIEIEPDQSQLTSRYTEEAIEWITTNRHRPFFLYLAHSMVHDPLHASEKFLGKSKNGVFGDAVEEIDWSTGKILQTLRELDLDDDTLVIFTSDNGGCLRYGSSNAPLRGEKATTWEGGVRVPCIMHWPGVIPASTTCRELATIMDLLPTFAKLSGAEPPTDRIIDGKDITALITGEPDARSPHEVFYYYFWGNLEAVRWGKWKLHLARKDRPRQLYDLDADIGETDNVAGRHPETVARLEALAEKAREDMGDGKRPGKNQRPAAFIKDYKPLTKRQH